MSGEAAEQPATAAPEQQETSQQEATKVLPEMACGECEATIATVYCNECHEQYCKDCTNVVHAKGRRKLHSDFARLFTCGECEVVFSTVECSQCQETFCKPCCDKVHSKGQRKEKIKLHQFSLLARRNLSVANHEQSNAFGILRSELHWQRYTGLGSLSEQGGPLDEDTAAAIEEADECNLRIGLLDKEKFELFRDTLCTLSPDQPAPVDLISTGTDDESVLRVEEQRIKRQNSFDARSAMFGDEIKEFSCWRRITDLAPEDASLFCHRAHASLHDLPESLTTFPDKQNIPDAAAAKKAKEETQSIDVTPKPPKRRGDPNASLLTQCNASLLNTVSGFKHLGFVPSFQKGSLADNFVLLAVAAVMRNRQAFTDLFASCEHLDDGMITFRFFETQKRFVEPEVSPRRQDGVLPGSEKNLPPPTPKSTFVTVDTLVPCSEQGSVGNQVAVGRTDHESEFGIALLEKAYATFVGSYARLHHGRVDRVLEHFTRGEGTFLRWGREEGSRLSPHGMSQLRWYLQEATLLRLPIVATDTLQCHTLEGTANNRVKPLSGFGLRNELFAQHADTSAADFDWSVGSVVHFAVDYHQPVDPTAVTDHSGPGRSPVPYNKTPRSSNTSRYHNRGADIAKTWHLVKTQKLYDEIDDPFSQDLDDLHSPDEASAEARPFSEQSPHWTKHARKTLNHFSVDTKLKWETIEDFATSHDCIVMMRNTYLNPDALMHFASIPHSVRPHNVALHLPHFLLAVEKTDNTLDEAASMTQAVIKTDFTDMTQDLVPPAMDLGEDESDDEVDPMAKSSSSRMSSSMGDRLLPNSSQTLGLQFRVSFPSHPVDQSSYVPFSPEGRSEVDPPKPTYRPDNMTVMVFRVPGPQKQKCVMTEVDGRQTARLPTHSRVNVSLVSTTENEMLFQLDGANTGFYNVVLVPTDSCFPIWTKEQEDAAPQPGCGLRSETGQELNNFVYSLTTIKRQNGDAYSVNFCQL